MDVGAPAPYGQACASCSRSKTKCIIRATATGRPCERCHRKSLECRPAVAVRRRNPAKTPISSRTREARLEAKLDGLISLMSARAPSIGDDSIGVGTSTRTASTASLDHTPPAFIPYNRQPEEASLPMDHLSGDNHHIPSPVFSTTAAAAAPASLLYEPCPSEAEEHLANFRLNKLKYFPFVWIPATTSAAQLKQEKPFLWLCVMYAGSKSTAQQKMLAKVIRQTIAQEMVVASTANMDILLGTLAFIAWSNYQVASKPCLTVFSQLAVSMVFELGLAKSETKPETTTQPPNYPCGTLRYARPRTPRTMEERRAVLGCFLATSMISSFLQKTDALRWTPHMDECLEVLEERKECPNDRTLVEQVRLQLIVERISIRTNSHEGGLDLTEPASPSLEGLYSRLQRLSIRLLADFQDNEIVLLHLHSACVEAALSSKSSLLTAQEEVTPQGQKCLKRCLGSIKAWFDIFFAMSPAAYADVSLSICAQLVCCLTTLFRIKTLTVDYSTWGEGKSAIWETVDDPIVVLDRVISNTEQVATLAGLDNSRHISASYNGDEYGGGGGVEEDIFSKVAQMLRSLRGGWEARLRPPQPQPQSQGGGMGPVGGLAAAVGVGDDAPPQSNNMDDIDMSLFDSFGMELFDNDWWFTNAAMQAASYQNT
ncbi:hypothetical protein B0T17DRAFT_513611 [Bombardia bombarda]|uniref:Zn(2)-C6 fungal-type domain-containing protein n=1 Tax=Bombardia bombarda TaxID=252184 RepID=A0AA39XIB3_9PEZI|nr:hypothetical protein B0T17DRAFT_513611 [Bombardia bombarda]